MSEMADAVQKIAAPLFPFGANRCCPDVDHRPQNALLILLKAAPPALADRMKLL